MLNVSIASSLVDAIVKHQRDIIGPLAIEQASSVPGIVVSGSKIQVVTNSTDASLIVSSLVKKYEQLFGQASIEACKDAVKELSIDVNQKDLPTILQ